MGNAGPGKQFEICRLEIVTRDAKGGDFFLYLDKEMPPRTRPVSSATVPFPASPTGGAQGRPRH